MSRTVEEIERQIDEVRKDMAGLVEYGPMAELLLAEWRKLNQELARAKREAAR